MIFNPKKLFICLFFFAIPLGSFAKNKALLFSMEDLSILKKQKNFKEFLAHALDIRPSKRNKKWEEIAQSGRDFAMNELNNENAVKKKLLIDYLSLYLRILKKSKKNKFIIWKNLVLIIKNNFWINLVATITNLSSH